MAGEAATPLLSCGPFLGIDNTQTDIYVSPSKGLSMIAGDCEIIPKSLIASPGRTLLGSFFLPAGAGIGAIAQADSGFVSGVPVISILYGSRVQDYVANIGGRAKTFSPTWGGSAFPGGRQDKPDGMTFTQAVVGSTTMGAGATPASPHLFPFYLDNYGVQTGIFNDGLFAYIQHDAVSPNHLEPTYTASPVGGSMDTGIYTYAFTYVSRFSVSGSNQFGEETSPFINNFFTASVTGPTGSNALTPGSGSVWYGTFPNDPQANYSTRIYRSSNNQPTFFFVGEAEPSSSGGPFNGGVTTPGSTFTDTLSDATISANAQLTLNRDPPPVKYYNDFEDNGGILPLYYQGAPMWLHQERLWYFAMVQNQDTGFSGQFQLWYSNSERAWEFDKVNNVFLVGVPGYLVPTALGLNPPVIGSNPYAYPNNLYVELPSAGISLASVSLFWTTKKMYILYGNSQATYTFQKFGDIGCSSPASLAYAATDQATGVFWMNENGVYFTGGQSYQYISEDIRSVIDNLNISDRYNCVGFFANHTYYISFPTLNQTWAYRTTTNQWHGPLPYSTSAISDVASDQRVDGSTATNGTMNSVVAVRGVETGIVHLDTWFTGGDLDLGTGQTVTYQSNDQVATNPHIEKEWTQIAITHKKQATPILATCTITVDDDPTKVCTVTFDMSRGPTQIATLSYEGSGGGPLRGYVANLKIVFTTVAGNITAPIQIKNVTVYGKDRSLNLTPTVNMGNNAI